MWHFIKGCVIIRVNAKHPERLLNLMRENGVPVRRVYGEKRGEVQLAITPRDFKRLRPLARAANCRVHIVGRDGAPFALNRLWRRPVLWAGTLLMMGAIAFRRRGLCTSRSTGASACRRPSCCGRLPSRG